MNGSKATQRARNDFMFRVLIQRNALKGAQAELHPRDGIGRIGMARAEAIDAAGESKGTRREHEACRLDLNRHRRFCPELELISREAGRCLLLQGFELLAQMALTMAGAHGLHHITLHAELALHIGPTHLELKHA